MIGSIDFDGIIFVYTLIFFIALDAYKKGFFNRFFRNFINEIKEKKKFFISAVLIIPFIIRFLDLKLTVYFRDNHTPFLTSLAKLGNLFGYGKFIFSLLATGALIATLLNNKKLKNLFYMALSCSLITSGLNLLWKTIFYRQRPSIEYNPFFIFAYKHSIEAGKAFSSIYASFPSGHTTSITGACIIFALYFKNIYLKTFFCILPFLTAYARVYAQRHWLSDVFMAYVIGVIFAISFYKTNSHKI